MRHLSLAFGILALAPAAVQGQATRDSAAFVTRLGNDTLVVEQFTRSRDSRGERVEAKVLLRVPRTTLTEYVLELTPTGELTRLQAVSPQRRETITRTGRGDSLRIETSDTGAPRVRTIAADRAALPFLDMVHWPFDIVLTRFRATGTAQRMQPLLCGARVADFALATVGPDSMTITHPTRGTRCAM